tara:strand:- start:184 stop:444 length:261 start_codon:yes stop_codon:yes gene_type:complete
MRLSILLLENIEAPDPLAMVPTWPGRLRETYVPPPPPTDVEAMAVIATVDAAYGRIGPELFAAAKAPTFLIMASLIPCDPAMMSRA